MKTKASILVRLAAALCLAQTATEYGKSGQSIASPGSCNCTCGCKLDMTCGMPPHRHLPGVQSRQDPHREHA